MSFDAMDKLVFAFLGLFGLMIVGLILLAAIYTPVSLAASAGCLAKGYPKSAVTWDFKKYCMNLEGTVTVDVEAL